MRPFYSLVAPNGYISLSLITLDPDTFEVEPGFRLLVDNPPDPNLGEYIPGKTRPVRVEPVPDDATEIPYIIVDSGIA